MSTLLARGPAPAGAATTRSSASLRACRGPAPFRSHFQSVVASAAPAAQDAPAPEKPQKQQKQQQQKKQVRNGVLRIWNYVERQSAQWSGRGTVGELGFVPHARPRVDCCWHSQHRCCKVWHRSPIMQDVPCRKCMSEQHARTAGLP